jgi:DNA-binding MarR family transcriptional regulator
MVQTSVPSLPCMCASLRRATRVVTQRYDEALRHTGLTITQFTILRTISATGEITQGRLGTILAMDSTTLTRTLGLMKRRGWIAKDHGEDRRERRMRLTRGGRTELDRAVPHWQAAQEALRTRLGRQRWEALAELIGDVTSIVAKQGDVDGTAI